MYSLNRLHARWLASLLVGLLLFTTASCSFGESAPPTPAPVTVQWYTFDPQSPAEKEIIKRYQAEFPQVRFKRNQVNFPLIDAQTATPPPDLVNAVTDFYFGESLRQEQLLDLSEVLAESEVQNALPPSINQLITQDGKVYLALIAFAWAGIFYNPMVFADYGLTPPTTWDDLLDACGQLRAAGEIPFSLSGEGYTFTLWFEYLNLRLNGAQFHRDLLAGKESYKDERVGQVMETFTSLFDYDCFVKHPEVMNDEEVLIALIRSDNGRLVGEEAVMGLSDSFQFGQLEPKLQEELDFFAFPTLDPQVANAEVAIVTGYVVPKSALQIATTVEFLKFLTSVKAQEEIATRSFLNGARLTPVRKDIKSELLTPMIKEAIDHIHSAQELVPQIAAWLPGEMQASFGQAYRKFILDPSHDPGAFINTLEETRLQLVKSGVYYEN